MNLLTSIAIVCILMNFVSSQSSNWTNMNGLGTSAFVNALIANGNDIYIGGTFELYSNLAKYFISNVFFVIHYFSIHFFFFKQKDLIF